MNISNSFLFKMFILAAPVRLELTTHGLTGQRTLFESLKAFILKGFSVFLFGPHFSP